MTMIAYLEAEIREHEDSALRFEKLGNMTSAGEHRMCAQTLRAALKHARAEPRQPDDLRTLAECGRRCIVNAAGHRQSAEALMRGVPKIEDPIRRRAERALAWRESGAADVLELMGAHFQREAAQGWRALAAGAPGASAEVIRNLTAVLRDVIRRDRDEIERRVPVLRADIGDSLMTLAAVCVDPILNAAVAQTTNLVTHTAALRLLQRCFAAWECGEDDLRLCDDLREFLQGPSTWPTFATQMDVQAQVEAEVKDDVPPSEGEEP